MLVERKVEDKVFDRRTLMHIYRLMGRKLFYSVERPISEGKEARVFVGRNGKQVAIKVYRIEAAVFQTIQNYVRGDPRFWGVAKRKSQLIYAWTRKEFSNLKRLREAGLSVPEPLAFEGNVLVMQYLGGREPAPSIRGVELPEPDAVFERLVDFVKRAYHDARLVHADLSEYNVLYWRKRPYVIDVGQAVDTHHPRAREFLERDVRNLCRFFSKPHPERIIKDIIGGRGG